MRKDKRDENLQKKRMVSSAMVPGGVEAPGSANVQQKVRRRLPADPDHAASNQTLQPASP